MKKSVRSAILATTLLAAATPAVHAGWFSKFTSNFTNTVLNISTGGAAGFTSGNGFFGSVVNQDLSGLAIGWGLGGGNVGDSMATYSQDGVVLSGSAGSFNANTVGYGYDSGGNRRDWTDRSETTNGTTTTYPFTITKEGAGTWGVSGPASNTGTVWIKEGVLIVPNFGNIGDKSGIGIGTADASSLILGTLTTTGTLALPSAVQSDRLFSLAGNGVIANTGTGTVAFTNEGGIVSAGVGNRTLYFRGTQVGQNVFMPAILAPDNAIFKTSVAKNDGGAWVFGSTASTFNGVMHINDGMALVTKLAPGGVASSIGAGTASSSGLTIGDVVTTKVDTTEETTIAGAPGSMTKTVKTTVVTTRTGHYSGLLSTNNTSTTAPAEAIPDATPGTTSTTTTTATDAKTSALLSYIGLSSASTNRSFTIGGDATITNDSEGSLSFTSTDDVEFVGTGSRNLALGGLAQTTNLFALSYGDNGAAANSLTKITAGSTWALTGNNTYSGGTFINAGTLQIGNGGTSGSLGSGVIVNNGTLAFDRSDAQTLSRTISGTGIISQLGAGKLTVTSNSLSTGGWHVGDGATLQIGVGGTDGVVGSGAIATDGEFIINHSDTVTLNQSVSGAGKLTQAGTGLLVLTADNSYSGGTIVGSGGIQVGNGGASGSLGSGAVAATGDVIFNRSGTVTVPGNITGTGALVQAGTGTLIVTGNSSLSGGVRVNSGTLQVGDATTAGAIAGKITIASGASLSVFTQRDSASTLTGPVTGAGNVAVMGAGSATFSGTGSYTGTTTIDGATLRAGIIGMGGLASSLGASASDATNLVLSGTTLAGSGKLSYIGADNTTTDRLFSVNGFGAISSDGAGALSFGNQGAAQFTGTTPTLTLAGTNTGNNIFMPVISDGNGGTTATSLIKDGAGTWILGANNTYTGLTNIHAGTLIVGNGGAAGSLGTGNVQNDGLLVFNRSDDLTISNKITGTGIITQTGTGKVILLDNECSGGLLIAQGSTLQFGAGGSTGSLGLGSVVNNGTLVIDRADDVTIANAISGTGELRKNGANKVTLTGDGVSSGSATIASGTLQLGNGGISGSLGSAAVTNNGSLVFNRADSHAHDLTISGTGTVTQAGSGTTILTGNNSYTGDTFITAGTLQVGNGGTSGSLGSGTIHNDGALTFNRSDIYTIGNAITGAGTVRFSGTGTAVLTGACDATGTTTIDAATTLQIGNGASTGSLASHALTVNGALVFDRADSMTLSSAVSGRGSLSQAGAGTLVVTTDISSLSAITIAAGTLQLGAADTSGNLGTGSITNNGMLAFSRSDSITASNAISGTGSLTQAGTGSLVLTGNNTYSGATLINSGTLQVGNGGAAGSIGTGAVMNSGSLVFMRSDACTVAGVISGIGSLTQAGTGATILTGSNTYTGDTFITSGTLQVGNGGTSGSLGSGAVTDNGSLVFMRSDACTVTGVISGTGSLTQAGTGTLILTGNNTYSGPTTVSTGTLRIDNGGTLGTGAVTDNGSLVFNRSDACTVANAISGTGALTQAGAGTLELTGANTHTGGTTVANGTLLVHSDAALGTGPVTVAAGALLEVSTGTANTPFGKSASGSGSADFTGSGVKLSADIAMPASVTVTNSSLDLGGHSVTASTLSVLAGSTLKGVGSVNGSLINRGVVAPGNSPGLISVSGDYTGVSGSSLDMQIGGTAAGTQYDQIKYTGTAHLGGTLHVSWINGYTPANGATFHLLQYDGAATTASTVTGAFSAVNIDPIGAFVFTPPVKDGFEILVVSSLSTIPGVTIREGARPFSDYLTDLGPSDPRAQRVAAAINSQGVAAAGAVLDSASPAGFASVAGLVTDENRGAASFFRERAARRTTSECVEPAYPTATGRYASSYSSYYNRPAETDWVADAGFSIANNTAARDASAPAFDHSNAAGFAALERGVSRDVSVGAVARYDKGSADFHEAAGTLSQDRASLGVFATGDFANAAFWSGAAFVGHSSYDSTRTPLGSSEKGGFSGLDYGISGDLGIHRSIFREIEVSPFVGFTYSHVGMGAFSETGDNLALAVSSGSYDSLRARVGSAFDWTFGSEVGKIRLGFDLEYDQELLDNGMTVTARFADTPGATFTGKSPALDSGFFSVGPHVGWQVTASTAVSLGYKREIGTDGSSANRFDASVSVKF